MTNMTFSYPPERLPNAPRHSMKTILIGVLFVCILLLSFFIGYFYRGTSAPQIILSNPHPENIFPIARDDPSVESTGIQYVLNTDITAVSKVNKDTIITIKTPGTDTFTIQPNTPLFLYQSSIKKAQPTSPSTLAVDDHITINVFYSIADEKWYITSLIDYKSAPQLNAQSILPSIKSNR